MIAKMTQTRTDVVANHSNQLPVETLEPILVTIGAKTINSIGTIILSKSQLTTAFIIHQNSIPRSSGCQSQQDRAFQAIDCAWAIQYA